MMMIDVLANSNNVMYYFLSYGKLIKKMSKPTDGPGAYLTAHAQIHLEKHCNEAGHSST